MRELEVRKGRCLECKRSVWQRFSGISRAGESPKLAPKLLRMIAELRERFHIINLMRTFLDRYRDEYVNAIASLDIRKVAEFIDILRAARDIDQQIFVFGNGGSAAVASHFAVDMAKGASWWQEKQFRVWALADQTGSITAYANDVGYEVVFREQLRNFARPGDIAIAISSSGNSPNVLHAIEYANEAGCITIGMSGSGGGELAALAQHSLVTQSHHVGQIEDSHMYACHMIAYYFIEQRVMAAVPLS